MLDWLLDAQRFLLLLIAAAVLTPPGAWLVWRWRPGLGKRLLLVLGGSGPAVLVLWGVHNAVLAVLGFDSLLAAIVMLALGGAIGWLAGEWVRGEPVQPD